MPREYSIGGLITFPQLTGSYGLVSGLIGAASLINPHLCYDLVGKPSRWVPMLESTAGLYTLRLLGLQTVAMATLSIHAACNIQEPAKRQQMSNVLAALNIGNGLIAAWMYKEGVLNPFGVSLHAGLSLVLGLGFLFYGIREERVEQQ
jgi:hypothetical protein